MWVLQVARSGEAAQSGLWRLPACTEREIWSGCSMVARRALGGGVPDATPGPGLGRPGRGSVRTSALPAPAGGNRGRGRLARSASCSRLPSLSDTPGGRWGRPAQTALRLRPKPKQKGGAAARSPRLNPDGGRLAPAVQARPCATEARPRTRRRSYFFRRPARIHRLRRDRRPGGPATTSRSRPGPRTGRQFQPCLTCHPSY